jgi:signal transduction histidine kinase
MTLPEPRGGDVSEQSVVKESMRRLPLFEGLGDADLDRLVELSSSMRLGAGESLMREGESGDTMYVIVEGEFDVVKRQGNTESEFAVRGPGDVVGEMALLQHLPRTASVRARSEARLLVIDHQAFLQLLSCSPTAATTILATVTRRLRSTESMLMHQAKLAALGTMAAGLAHELNNPAAAIRRSAHQLREAVAAMDAATAALARQTLDERESLAFDALRDGVPPGLDRPGSVRASRLEEEVETWLEEEVGLDGAWSLSPALVATGWTRTALEERLAPFTTEHKTAVARWLAARASATELFEELRLGGEAISDIVSSVKRYTYLDQAPVQEVDVHDGVETTLRIMKHKLGDGVEVVREYAADLPAIEAHGSELNQVWTNLIDNAVDAMGGRGTVTIRTSASDHDVIIEIRDTGPGIPEAVQARLFEPFFTTKDVGEGTGLGLHISYTIVVHRHRGSLDVRSRPGDTCFRVTLPRSLGGP